MNTDRTHPLIAAAVQFFGSQARLAKQIDCVQQTVSKMLNREIEVSPQIAARIDLATEGKVPREKLRPDVFFVRPPTSDGEGAR